MSHISYGILFPSTVYVRYIKGDDLKEEYLFSKLLSTTTHGEDVFGTVKNFVDEMELQWSKLIGRTV